MLPLASGICSKFFRPLMERDVTLSYCHMFSGYFKFQFLGVSLKSLLFCMRFVNLRIELRALFHNKYFTFLIQKITAKSINRCLDITSRDTSYVTRQTRRQLEKFRYKIASLKTQIPSSRLQRQHSWQPTDNLRPANVIERASILSGVLWWHFRSETFSIHE